jgi:myosin heavy subunit
MHNKQNSAGGVPRQTEQDIAAARERQAVLDKYAKASFGKIRKSFIDALIAVSRQDYSSLKAARGICQEIKEWVDRNPAADPGELMRALTGWANAAKADEGFGVGSRDFIRRLNDLVLQYSTDLIIVMCENELSFKPDQPQAGNAAAAKSLQDRLDTLQVEMGTLKKVHGDDIDSLKKAHGDAIDTLKKANTEEIDKLKATISTQEREIDKLKLEHGHALDKLKGTLSTQEKEIERLAALTVAQKQEIDTLTKSNNEQLRSIDAHKHNISMLEEHKERLTKLGEQQQRQIEVLSHSEKEHLKEISAQQSSHQPKDVLIARMTDDTATLKLRLDNAEAETKLLREADSRLKLEGAALNAQLETAEKALASVQKEQTNAKAQKEADAKRLSEQQATISKLEAQLAASQKSNDDLATREKNLQVQAEKNTEKFFTTVKDTVQSFHDSLAEIKQNRSNVSGYAAPGFTALPPAPRSLNAPIVGSSSTLFKTPGAPVVKKQTPAATTALEGVTSAAPVAEIVTAETKIKSFTKLLLETNCISPVRVDAVVQLANFLQYCGNADLKAKDLPLYSFLIKSIKQLVDRSDPSTPEICINKILEDASTVQINGAFTNVFQKLKASLVPLLDAQQSETPENFESKRVFKLMANLFCKSAYPVEDLFEHFKAVSEQEFASSETPNSLNKSRSKSMDASIIQPPVSNGFGHSGAK